MMDIQDYKSIPAWVCRNLAQDLACAVNSKTYEAIKVDLKEYMGNIPYQVLKRSNKDDGAVIGYIIKVGLGGSK